jgi:hypothetical protein
MESDTFNFRRYKHSIQDTIAHNAEIDTIGVLGSYLAFYTLKDLL